MSRRQKLSEYHTCKMSNARKVLRGIRRPGFVSVGTCYSLRCFFSCVSGLWSLVCVFSLFWFCGVFCACSRVCCVLCGCVSCVSVCSFLHLTVVVPFWPPSLPESPRVLHAVRVPSSLLSPQWLSIENLDPPPNTAITQNGSQAPQQRT